MDRKPRLNIYRRRSDVAQRESPYMCLGPVSGLASGPYVRETAPSRACSTVAIAVSGSLTVAWAAPALHSSRECAPASRFTPGNESPGTPETLRSLRGSIRVCKRRASAPGAPRVQRGVSAWVSPEGEDSYSRLQRREGSHWWR